MTETDALFERLLITYEQNPEEIETEQPLIAKALQRAKANEGLEDSLADTQGRLRDERAETRSLREKIAGLQEELNVTRQKLDDEDAVHKRLQQMQEGFEAAIEGARKRTLAPNLIEPSYGKGEEQQLAGKGWKKGIA